jgi:hypothetical protein
LTRWCSAPNAVGVALAAAIGLSPMPGLAQTASPGSDLLQPSLDGNPANPPRFRQPGEAATSGNRSLPPGTFTATSRLGATPIYGSPAGFGAGDTGFDSKNTPRGKKLAQTPPQSPAGGATPQPETTFAPVQSYTSRATSKPAAPKKPPAPEIHPIKAATRTGAVLPPPPEPPPLSNPPPEVHPLTAANRPGAVLPVPPPEYFDYTASTPPPTTPQPNTLTPGTVPQRQLPLAAGDPYAALGIRAGSFLLLPSLDLTAGYNTNPERVTGSGGAPYFIAAPELQVRSDWERHSLTADITGSYTEYGENLVPSLNVPYLNAKIDGRVDVTRDTQILLDQRFLINTDNPGSPNLRTNQQAQLAQLPLNFDVGETVGVAQQFNRLSFSLRGTFDRSTYDESLLTDGETSSNADRNFNQYAGILRAGYELDPGFKPFVELEGDERIHDEQFDRNGLQRDSVGASGKVGAAVDLFGSLTGEMAVGYVERTYQDPTLPNVSGVIADGSLLWQATPLTSAKLTATSQVYETVVAGASGELSRDVSLQIDHAFQYWLVGTLKGGYGNDNYVGVFTDNRYFVSVGLAYKLTREMQIRTELRQDWLTTTEPGFTYTATTALIGLRLQR